MTFALLWWMACNGAAPDRAEAPTAPAPAPEGSPVDTASAPDPETPLDLEVRFVPEGAPRAILVQLDRDLFTATEVGAAPTGFELAVKPAIAGTLTVTAADQLQFEPSAPLRPGTRYVATVTRTAADAPPAGPWTGTVDTPPFGLTRATLRQLAPPGRPVGVDLVFSSAVDVDAVRRAVSARIGDEAVKVSFEPGDGPNVVTGWLVRPGTGDEVTVELAARRVPWAGDDAVLAPGARHAVSLKSGPQMQILHAVLREGTDGWFVEVICTDAASHGRKRYRYLHDVGSFEVSPRCALDEDFARAMVHTDPPTELSFAAGEAGFRVFGGFPRGELRLSIDAGVRTVDGGVLDRAWSKAFTVPARSPRVRFADQGRYLPRAAWRSLDVRHVNVDQVAVEVRHARPENLVFWLTGGDERMTDRTSDRVVSTSIAVRSPPDREVTSSLPLSTLIHDPEPGVYEIKIGDGPGASARILRTDLHLIAKAAGPRPGAAPIPAIQVWALDVNTGAALSGVRVEAVRTSGTPVGQCTTRGEAGCTLSIARDPADDTPPVALIARLGQDFTYIALKDLRLGLPADASGPPFTSAAPYRAPLWTDRGVYRPGDAAHVAGLVRTAAHVAPPPGLPVVLRLYDPKNRETRKRVAETNAAGLVAADFRFGDHAPTGKYRVVAEIGGQPVGELGFQVEEFVPERLKVTAKAAAAGYGSDDPVPIEVTGAWLFGGSAAGARVEVACRVAPAPFTADGFDGWSFGPAYLDGPPQPVTLGTVAGTLGDDGTADVVCPAAGPGGVRGPSELVADAAVFEGETGRTTVAVARTRIHPERYVLGLDTSADKALAGRTMAFQGAVLGWDGRIRPKSRKTVSVEVFRMEEEYGWYYDDTRGTGLQQRQLRPVREKALKVPVTDGRFRFDVVPESDSAGTLVRVRAGNAVTERFVEGTGTRYWWDDSEPARVVDATPRPVRPTAVRIAAPASFEVGEVGEVTVTAPYAGRMLLTLETDEVLRSAWVDAKAGDNRWTVAVDRFVPNVYVSALLIKDPHLESAAAFLPDRAFGVAAIRVEPTAYRRTLTLTAPETTKPYRRLSVELQLERGAGGFATVAAVDEGILSLTRFPNPDPLGDLFVRRALGVSTYETVGWTRAVAAAGTSSSTGGDQDEAEDEPQHGQRVQMVKPVALWSGVVPLDDDGRAKVAFDVPGYRGKLRIMAVAATADGIGAATAQVTVRDPLVLATTLPRFLLAGDVAEIPVMVTNMTGAAREVTVEVEAEELSRGATPDATAGPPLPPPLQFPEGATRTLSIPAGRSGTTVVRVAARNVPGAAHLRVTARADRFFSKEELDLPIGVVRSEVRRVDHLTLTDARTDLTPILAGWADGSDRTTLWLTRNPYAESLTALRYLVRYPFG